MHQPAAYLNGKFIDADRAVVHVTDAGFTMGAAVSERLRTFDARLFAVDEHLDRFEQSLAAVGIAPAESRDEIARIAAELAARNHALLNAADDLALSLFATPGQSALARDARPTLGMHTFALPFANWAGAYKDGESLVTVDVRQVPAACWPPSVKHRSRLHYYLAELEAWRIDAAARALLLDERGMVNETPTANVVAWFEGEGIVSPHLDVVLGGITLAATRRLAGELGLRWTHRDIAIDELRGASEVLLTSTPFAILPVVRCDGRPIGDGRPGRIFRELLAAWNRLAGIDIAEQARRFAERVGR